jgi:hypothetical protein
MTRSELAFMVFILFVAMVEVLAIFFWAGPMGLERGFWGY